MEISCCLKNATATNGEKIVIVLFFSDFFFFINYYLNLQDSLKPNFLSYSFDLAFHLVNIKLMIFDELEYFLFT